MLKKLLLTILFVLILAPSTFAQEDFSQMNPTVKITSYKKLFIDQVLAYGSGSGTVISPDGLVVSNHHVIFDENEFKPLDAFEVCITFDVQKEPVCNYTARLVDFDKDMDIALLKINSTDVFGMPVPTLKHLNYHNDGAPEEQSQIHVVGYPGSGGDTITMTQGQISGFEEFNNFQYFKTDTDFDHGSSGGTALDENGNFIGIPTYIRSYAENVGYFLNLKEARGWLNNVEDKKPEENLSAEQLLKKELVRFSRANEDLKYTQEHYPFLQLALPEGWEFLEINDDSFFATQKNQSNPVGISVFIAPYQFKVDDGYLDKLNEELEGVKETFPDYKKEETTFAGQPAWKVTYTSMSSKNITYYLPYGYAMIGIGYSIDLNEEEIQIAAMEPVIDALVFIKEPFDDPQLSQVIQFDNPPFEITMAGDWSALKNKDKQSRTLLVEAVEKDNFEGSFAIYYDQVSKDERHLTAKIRLEEVIKNLGSRKLVYKNDEVVLGGLEGYLYTYEYEGRDYQKIRKHMIAKVRDGDYEFSIEYDDLTEDFDRNLTTIQNVLDSFRFKGKTTTETTISSYGNLGFTFKDIQFHRYALSISELAEKGIIGGYSDGTFRPEASVNRVEALKMILESKNHLEKEKGSKEVVVFEQFTVNSILLRDVKSEDWFEKYVGYALEKKIIEGYGDSTLRPNQAVTLAEAMKLMLNVYEIPVWNGMTNPWYKKYMEKGFELHLIPYGMYDSNQRLTRAELAHLVNTVYGQAK